MPFKGLQLHSQAQLILVMALTFQNETIICFIIKEIHNTKLLALKVACWGRQGGSDMGKAATAASPTSTKLLLLGAAEEVR